MIYTRIRKTVAHAWRDQKKGDNVTTKLTRKKFPVKSSLSQGKKRSNVSTGNGAKNNGR